jgi:hypothetical protein
MVTIYPSQQNINSFLARKRPEKKQENSRSLLFVFCAIKLKPDTGYCTAFFREKTAPKEE